MVGVLKLLVDHGNRLSMRFVGHDKRPSLVGDLYALQRSCLFCSQLPNYGLPCSSPIPDDSGCVDGDFNHIAEARPELPALDGDPHRAFESCRHIAAVGLLHCPYGVCYRTLQRGVFLAEVCAVMLEDRRPSEILSAERAVAGRVTALPLRHPAHPVSYPRLTAKPQASQMFLDTRQSCRVHGMQIMVQDSLGRGEIELGEIQRIEALHRADRILIPCCGESPRRFLDRLLNIGTCRQRAEGVHGERPTVRGWNRSLPDPQFAIVYFDSRNELLDLRAQRDRLGAKN